jgi:hypothetical protein
MLPGWRVRRWRRRRAMSFGLLLLVVLLVLAVLVRRTEMPRVFLAPVNAEASISASG